MFLVRNLIMLYLYTIVSWKLKYKFILMYPYLPSSQNTLGEILETKLGKSLLSQNFSSRLEPLLREDYLYHIRWIFGKLPNGLWPPSIAQYYISLYLGCYLKMLKIHKYASNTNTNTHGKTRNTQIQKYRHTQIQILLLGVSARSEEERIEIFLQKVV